MGKIIITSGPDTGKEYPLTDSQVLGRLNRCTITLRDTRASREHARIFKNQGTYFIVDLESKNGIVLHGKTIRKAQLTPGDEMQVGETWLKVDFDPDPLPDPQRSSATPPPSAGRLLTPDIKVRTDGPGISAEPIRTGAHARSGGRTQDHMTRTSLSWLRTDLSQVSRLYQVMLYIGL
ncbi:MAG: hypothetical protein CMJ83_17970, partial [Planctomycetes bacterium]|nr:hypothetical protein [Planctomycetota bacterium]